MSAATIFGNEGAADFKNGVANEMDNWVSSVPSSDSGVIEGFNELVASYKGELNVTITSAAPLPRDIQTRLETLLKQSQAAQQAKSLKITNKVRYMLTDKYHTS